MWPLAYRYIADVNNHCASPFLGWKTPISKRHGYTPDISSFLFYMFWEAVYYKVDDKISNTQERKGRWVGVSHHVGDLLTYLIYCPDTHKKISRSVIRTADPNKGAIINKCLYPDTSDVPVTSPEDSDILAAISDSGEIIGDITKPILRRLLRKHKGSPNLKKNKKRH